MSLVGVKKVPCRQFSGPCRLSLLPLGRPQQYHFLSSNGCFLRRKAYFNVSILNMTRRVFLHQKIQKGRLFFEPSRPAFRHTIPWRGGGVLPCMAYMWRAAGFDRVWFLTSLSWTYYIIQFYTSVLNRVWIFPKLGVVLRLSTLSGLYSVLQSYFGDVCGLLNTFKLC